MKLLTDIRLLYLLLLGVCLNFYTYTGTVSERVQNAYYDGCLMVGSEMEADWSTKDECEKLKEKYKNR